MANMTLTLLDIPFFGAGTGATCSAELDVSVRFLFVFVFFAREIPGVDLTRFEAGDVGVGEVALSMRIGFRGGDVDADAVGAGLARVGVTGAFDKTDWIWGGSGGVATGLGSGAGGSGF
jgi:hypothetical protein